MPKTSKNYEIEFFKLLFTVAILVFHSKLITCADGNPNLLPKGYLGVEFFFMVSGYFMAMSVERQAQQGRKQSPFQFVFQRGWRLMPALLFGFILSFVVRNCVLEPKSARDIWIALTYAIPEATMTGYIGVNFNSQYYNGPTWYISAMLCTMFVLYPLLRKHREKFGCYIAPILAVACYSYISFKNGDMAVLREWLGFIIGSTLRACGGLSLGITVYYICEKAKNSSVKLNLGGKIVVQLLEIAIGLVLYMYMHRAYNEDYHYASDYMFIFFCFILLIIVFGKDVDTNKIFGIKPLQWLYELSLPIYINQRIISHYLDLVHPEYEFHKSLWIYLIGTVVISIVSIPVTKLIELIINGIPKLLTTSKKDTQ